MPIFSLLAVVVFFVINCLVTGISMTFFVDLPTFLLILLVVCIMLLATNGFKDFGKAISITCKKKTDASLLQLKKSENIISLIIKAILCTGVLLSAFSIVTVLRNITDFAKVGVNLSVALLSTYYAVFMALVLLPVRTKLKNMILDFVSNQENS